MANAGPWNAVSGLESENDALKLKVDNIKGQYQRNINIMGGERRQANRICPGADPETPR